MLLESMAVLSEAWATLVDLLVAPPIPDPLPTVQAVMPILEGPHPQVE